MKVGTRSIDHIVYCVNDLDAAISDLKSKLGIAPIYGGRHLNQGTHNALLDLSDGCYLEILAIDKDNKKITGERWMGIDLIQEPAVTRWALKSDDLKSDRAPLMDFNEGLGQISNGTRKTPNGKLLVWRMLLPIAEPVIELMPFMVDWSMSRTHPTDNLVKGCQLKNLTLCAPPSNLLHKTFTQILEKKPELEEAAKPHISVTIEGPAGIVVL